MSIFSLESESGQDLTFPPLIDDSKQMFIIACFLSANLLKSRLLPEMITWNFSLKVKIYKFAYMYDYVYEKNIIANDIKLNY